MDTRLHAPAAALFALMVGCTGQLGDNKPTRSGLLVPASPETQRDLRIHAWDLQLDSLGRIHVTALNASGEAQGTFDYEMTSGRRGGPVLVVGGNFGKRGALRISRTGIEHRSLMRIRGAPAWVRALSRDVAAERPELEAYGPAPACADLIRTSARACTDTVLNCTEQSAACVAEARTCAHLSLRADRCQRRSL